MRSFSSLLFRPIFIICIDWLKVIFNSCLISHILIILRSICSWIKGRFIFQRFRNLHRSRQLSVLFVFRFAEFNSFIFQFLSHSLTMNVEWFCETQCKYLRFDTNLLNLFIWLCDYYCSCFLCLLYFLIFLLSFRFLMSWMLSTSLILLTFFISLIVSVIILFQFIVIISTFVVH